VGCLPLERCPPAKKGVTCSRPFGSHVTPLPGLREAVAAYAGRAAERMRRDGKAAGAATVSVNTNRFSVGAQYSNAAANRHIAALLLEV
jgi:DNA polymerase V